VTEHQLFGWLLLANVVALIVVLALWVRARRNLPK